MAEDSPISGHSLAELQFRQTYGANLVGIRRGKEKITAIDPTEKLRAGDCLIVIGRADVITSLKEQASL